MSTKNHSSEYLKEYLSNNKLPKWLTELIQEAIRSNGNLSDSNKDEIYNVLLLESGISEIQKKEVVASENEYDEQEITPEIENLQLDEITHIKGVNALTQNGTIPLSPNCTIIYGLNGTGKSGYFRIINELAGSDSVKKLIPNIHTEDTDFEVHINYTQDNVSQDTFIWNDRNKRGFYPFDRVRVFDTEYLPFYLDERESVLNIEPLGLHLFKSITAIIDEFKNRIKLEKIDLEDKRIDIQPLIDQINYDDIKNILVKESLDKNDEPLIFIEEFSDEDEAKLVKSQKDKEVLSKESTESQQKLLTQEIEKLNELNEYLATAKELVESTTTNSAEILKSYLTTKKERDQKNKEFTVLDSVPGKDTDEWNDFIDSAKEYKSIIDDNNFNKDKQCVYCHQELSSDAIKLTQSYLKYLSDKSSTEFKKSSVALQDQIETIKQIKVEFSLGQNLITELENQKNNETDDISNLYLEIKEIFTLARSQIKNVLHKLESKENLADDSCVLGIEYSVRKINALIKPKKELLASLSKTKDEKEKEVGKLNEQINQLEDKKLLKGWAEKTKHHFDNYSECERLEKTEKAISTTAITNLGSTAHDELLTNTLRTSFEEELGAFGKDDIEVTIEKIRSTKGTITTKLQILSNDVPEVLSEGEQKAVGLALYLAEINNSQSSLPIVFDDPVNSLDHKVSGKLAKRLIEISDTKQIIIFTHNKFFYDDLVYWANQLKDSTNQTKYHVCKNYSKNGCNAKGSHVLTYKVDKKTKNETGVITEYKQESCKYFVGRAEKEMKGDASVAVVSSHLKSAIEYYIDEKILMKTGLNSARTYKASIPWDQLKTIQPELTTIETLQKFWKDLSNRGTHLTQNSNENPLDTEELQNIIDFLKK